MSLITTHTAAETSTSLFKQLMLGNIVPDKLWLCRRFRAKFLLRSLVFPVTTLKYMRQFSALPDMAQALSIQGLLPAKPHRPYLYAGLSVAGRAAAITDHYRFLNQMKDGLLQQQLQSATATVMAQLLGRQEESITIQCAPGRFDREGEVTLELLFNQAVIASLSFSLINKAGVKTLLIGGLQGPRKHISSDVIKEATKACHGLFPKRLLTEALFIISERCGTAQIMAVSEETHVFRSLRYRHSKSDYFHASYSEFWLSIGGERQADGLYLLPARLERKTLEAIASKKRAEYRRRYQLLDELQQQVRAGRQHLL